MLSVLNILALAVRDSFESDDDALLTVWVIVQFSINGFFLFMMCGEYYAFGFVNSYRNSIR